MKIVKISRIRKIEPETRYDLEIENNHNYFANGILVHNCRCVVIIKDGHVTSWSRQGKMFETLHVLENELLELNRNNDNFLDHKVLDGEICIVDNAGNEDFKSIMKEIRRKDHTISNPMYLVYDMMDLDEFERGHTTRTFGERLAGLREALGDKGKHFRVLEQIHITGQEQFDRLFAEAQENGWE